MIRRNRRDATTEPADADAPGFEPAHDVPDKVRHELLHAFSDDPEAAASARAAAAAAPPERKTVVIESDDLPDAVSLVEGEVSPPTDPSPPRIVIDGGDDVVFFDGSADGSGDVATPDGTSPDPRLRARRIAVRRAESRRKLKWLAAILALVLLGVGVLVLLASPLFAIDTVDVEGAVYADPDMLDAVVSDLNGEPILVADLAGAERRLEEIPWVRDARVSMHFPNRVSIQIAERVPVAYFVGADALHRVIDVDGRVLDVIEGQPVDYMPIDGAGPNVAAGDYAGTTWRAAAQLANALPPLLTPLVQRLGVTAAGELTMVLSDPPSQSTIEVLFGFPDDFQSKLVALVNVLPGHEPGTISTIDVSSGEPAIR